MVSCPLGGTIRFQYFVFNQLTFEMWSLRGCDLLNVYQHGEIPCFFRVLHSSDQMPRPRISYNSSDIMELSAVGGSRAPTAV